MRTILIALSVCLLLSACSDSFDYRVGCHVLIETGDREPLAGKIVGHLRKADGLYYKARTDSGEIETFPASAITRSISTCGPVMMAQLEWQDRNHPQYIAKKERDRKAKRLILLCGVLPILLVALTHLHEIFALPCIAYFIVATLVAGFTFWAVLLFWAVLSLAYILLASPFLTEAGAWVSYVVLVAMLVL